MDVHVLCVCVCPVEEGGQEGVGGMFLHEAILLSTCLKGLIPFPHPSVCMCVYYSTIYMCNIYIFKHNKMVLDPPASLYFPYMHPRIMRRGVTVLLSLSLSYAAVAIN